ncbi:MAG: lipid-A-disaccharide synthase [Candidatus Omnitrophica bacterium]|nr:lipid-A-disaccharide synthase [Candidatus Omnitrophota bacterium]
MSDSIIIIAGEPSADMHGAALVKELKKHDPELMFYGIGSSLMQKAGVEIFTDLAQYAVIGFIEVLKHYPIFKKAFDLTLEKIQQIKPKALILIDYPGFNLRLAKKVKQLFPDIKIIYYISPQVWAWGKKRIKLIEKIVDKMLVVFDFEAELYQDNGIEAEFVGHPLMESIVLSKNKTELIKSKNLKLTDTIIALLPGSRQIEVKRLLPVMLSSADKLHKQMPEIKFLLIKAANIKEQAIAAYLKNYAHLPLNIISEHSYDFMSICSYAWVCSGTATLETAIIGIPMLITYKTSWLTWLMSKILIKLPYIGLVNIVAKKKIVPEFIQGQSNKNNIVNCTVNFLNQDSDFKHRQKQKLLSIKNKLGSGNVNQNAAQAIIKTIH